MEKDALVNSVMICNTGMEYTDGLMVKYITESTKRVIKMAKDMKSGQMAVNIGDSTRMTCNGEKESNKRREYFTE